MTPEALLILVGAVGGFWTGRWWAETGRGRYDAHRAWRGRRAYRRRRK